jgi:predicted nucleic acid-binding protein
MTALLDTNILLAASSPHDARHELAREAMRDLKGPRIVPAPVLPEVFYLLTRDVNYASAHRLFNSLQTTAFRIEPLTAADMARMSQIMRQYEDNRFDYPDTAIMALSNG